MIEYKFTHNMLEGHLIHKIEHSLPRICCLSIKISLMTEPIEVSISFLLICFFSPIPSPCGIGSNPLLLFPYELQTL